MTDFNWENEEAALRAVIFEGKRMGLDSFQDLLQADPLLLDKAIQFFHRAIDEEDMQDIAPHLIGVINEQEGGTWLFFQPNSTIFEGADAIFLKPEKPELGDRDSFVIKIDCDNWSIISKEPLLIRSIYCAVHGFKKTAEGVCCHTIDDGDSGWDGCAPDY